MAPERDGAVKEVAAQAARLGKPLPELAPPSTGLGEKEDDHLVSGPGAAAEAVLAAPARRRICARGAVRLVLALVTAAVVAAALLRFSAPAGRPPPAAPELCNASLRLSGAAPLGGGAAFRIPGAWAGKCRQAPEHTPVEKAGLNWCWQAVKMECYKPLWWGEYVTWQEAQRRAAKLGSAPSQEENASLLGLLHGELCDGRPAGEPAGAGDGDGGAAAARQWLAETVAVHVMNLDADTARLAAITGNLQRLGIQFRRVGGVRLTVANLAEAKSLGLLPRDYSLERAEVQSHSPRDVMEGHLYGTAGCFAAHTLAMRVALEASDSRPLVLILEDDVLLSDDFAHRLRRLLLEEAPCDWAVISLMSSCPYGECVSPHLTRVAPDLNMLAETCRQGVNFGAHAMLYRRDRLPDVRARLWATGFNESRPHCLDPDVALASLSDQFAYYAVPVFQGTRFVSFSTYNSSRLALR